MKSLETDATFWPADIAEMHEKFSVNTVIRSLDKEKLKMFLKFRLDFLTEELKEAYEAAGYTVDFKIEGDGQVKPENAEHIVDACIDLCVVAIGTLDAFDVDSYVAWNRVHSKNMLKEPGIKASRPNPLGLPDLIKPQNWTAPSHADNVGLLSELSK